MTDLHPRVLIYGVEALESIQLVENLVTFEPEVDVRCFRDVEVLIHQIGLSEDCVVALFDAPGNDQELAVVRRLHKLFAHLRVIVLIRDRVQSRVVEAFKAGAKGAISVNEGIAQIAKCIDKVSRGEVWATRRELSIILDALVRSDRPAPGSSSKKVLTRREEEVARLVVEGLSNRQISDALKLSESRVKNCIFHIFTKRGLSTRLELVHHVRRTAGSPKRQNTSSAFDCRFVRAISLSSARTAD